MFNNNFIFTNMVCYSRSLSGNNIEFNVPQDLGKLELLSKPQLIDNHADPQVNEIGCMNRKLGHW